MSPRPAAASYPVNLVLDGRSCLVVGGGTVAARKVEGLRACGANVRVIAPRVCDAIRRWPDVTVEQRAYRHGDVAGHWLVIAATDDPEVNGAVYGEGERSHVWVNGADDPAHCSFTLPSVLRRGPLVVSVSTSGRSPALSSWLRRRLEAEIGPEYEVLLELLSSERQVLQAEGRSTERFDWDKALGSGDLLELIRSGNLSSAREHLQTCLSSSSD